MTVALYRSTISMPIESQCVYIQMSHFLSFLHDLIFEIFVNSHVNNIALVLHSLIGFQCTAI